MVSDKLCHVFSAVLNHVMFKEKPEDICPSTADIRMSKLETDCRLKFRVYCRTKRFQRYQARLYKWNVPEDFIEWFADLRKFLLLF
jgi:hypothetical protein